VERGIGQLKRRFHVLHGEIRLSPEKSCKVIIACCVLHNICKSKQIGYHDDDDENGNDENGQQNDGHWHQNGQERLQYRQLFAENHFQ
jgi:hypothetical protein